MRYVFIYPSAKIGGAQLLFARIAEALIKVGKDILIVEQSRGFIHSYLQEKKLCFDVFKVSETDKFHAEEKDILVLSLSYVFLYRQFIVPHKNSRLVFWDLHPFALVESTALSKIHKEFPKSWLSIISKYIEKDFINKINTYISLANNHKALYFMCLDNYLANKTLFNLKIEPIFLPIPIVHNEVIRKIEKVNDAANPKLIKIGWISRMDPDKLAILELLINDVVQFNSLNSLCRIQLHAIGDGFTFEKISEQKIKIGDSLVLPGMLYGGELNNYLQDNIDVGFSMGTSALEFGSRKIATVLVPSTTCSKLFRKEQRRYKWLHDSLGFNLAVESIHLDFDIMDFETIINEFLVGDITLSEKSYEYVNQNHSFDIVFNRFLQFTEESTLTYSKLIESGVYNFSYFHRILLNIKKGFKTLTDEK